MDKFEVQLNFTSKDDWELTLCRINNARELYKSANSGVPQNELVKVFAAGWLDNQQDNLGRAVSRADLPGDMPIEVDNVVRPYSVILSFESELSYLTTFRKLHHGRELYQRGLDQNRLRIMDKAMSRIESGYVILMAAIDTKDLPAGNESAKP